MSELALVAASEWARAQASCAHDPIAFGKNVALAYCACQSTQHHAGDEKAMAAALASLSVPSEVLQVIAQLASLTPGNSEKTFQKPLVDVSGQA